MEFKKVLIVDDSSIVRDIFTRFFDKQSERRCKVLKAGNGVEALDILHEQDDIELILLDINMPMMDGVTFLTVLKRDQFYTDVPIIVISTEGSEEDIAKALALGAKGYLRKPINAKVLQAKLDSIVGDN